MIRTGATWAAIAASATLTAPLPLLAQVSSACPLPLSRQLDSIRAFAPIASFLTTEPRCVNCHGGVNPFIDGTGPDPEDADAPPSLTPHAGGRVRRQRDTAADGSPLIESECRDCHNNMAPRRDGSPSLWFTAPSFLSFVGKDAPTLCKQIKRATGTAEHFLGHLQDDNGGNNFSGTAFNGDRALNPEIFEVRADPPSISHPELMRLAQQWVDAMDRSFQGDEGCGCELELEGTFSYRDALSESSFTEVTGALVWAREESASAPARTLGDGESTVFRPVAGEITVRQSFLNPTIGGGPGQCQGSTERRFSVDELTPGALRYMVLEIGSDGRYQATLVIPDNPDPFPAWEYEATCSFPNVSTSQPVEVRYVAMLLGRQEGVVDDQGIAGRLAPPIRRGPRTVTGEWTFTAPRR